MCVIFFTPPLQPPLVEQTVESFGSLGHQYWAEVLSLWGSLRFPLWCIRMLHAHSSGILLGSPARLPH